MLGVGRDIRSDETSPDQLDNRTQKKESTRCPLGGPGAFRRGKKPLLIPERLGMPSYDSCFGRPILL